MNKERILIVDDKASICQVLSDILQTENYETITASSGEEGLAAYTEESPDLVLTDLKMTGISGVDLIKEIRKRDTTVPIILLTAFGSISSAVEAMKAGADDYLTKPLNYDLLKLKIFKILEEKKRVLENINLRQNLMEEWSLDRMIGKSPVMLKMFSLIKAVAPTETAVLITGECGTGKELIARSLFTNSLRSDRPFVVVDCSTIPEGLIESELFGYEKGAFSGADSQKKGRIEQAMGGTLFLDEIGEFPLSLQAKLLRIIQEKQFVRVGGTHHIEVDFRLIAATNRNLREEVSAGRFRSDLYYRLNVINIESSPLRNRKEDIPLLVETFMKTACENNNIPVKKMENRHLTALMNYSWPGNIRELKNCIEHFAILNTLPREIESGEDRFRSALSHTTLSDNERDLVLSALEKTDWNISKAAQLLGIGRKALYNRIQKYGLTAP